MRALLVNGTATLVDMARPVPPPGEARIRVVLAGVCNTDIEILKGYMDFHGVPGHEFVGVVEACGNKHLLGKRVTGEINCVCGQCRFCKLEMPHHCANRTVLGIQGRDGAFAEHLLLPEENLHIVPDTVPNEVAVFTEPVAAAFRIAEQLTISETDRVIVLGDGKLGQLIAQVMWLHSKQVTCIGKHKWKLELLERQHITTALDTDGVEPGADIVIEATGSATALQRAFELVRPQGTVVLKTTSADASQVNMALPVINEVNVLGSRCGPFRPALEALALGTIDVQHLVSEIYGLEDGVKALERATDPHVMKVLIKV